MKYILKPALKKYNISATIILEQNVFRFVLFDHQRKSLKCASDAKVIASHS